jgi:signal transduction histidine kinase
MAHMLSNFLILCFLVSFYAQNRKDLHSLNLSLDQRVQQAAQELETRYQHIKHDSIEAAAIHERSRIFQSIHEDLGDKLLQLVYLAKSNATADLARAALAELRDSRNLNPDHNRVLDEVLADAFAETQSRREPVQLTLKWDTQDSTQGIILNARQESVLTRTLREAISNIIKHASATTISLTFSCSSNAHRVLKYRILDDGVGIANDYVAGRGLVNMHQRMKELNGTLEVSRASPYGTLLLFQLPVMQGSI